MAIAPKEQIEAVKTAVKTTALFIQEEAQKFSRQDVGYKGWNDLVTYVDQQSETKLVSALNEILPEAGILAEEAHTELETDKAYHWIIDPLDGTLNFVHRLPMYAISVALWEPQEGLTLGVVYEPNLDECFHAIRGQGAFLNDEPINASPTEALENALFATGFPFIDASTVAHYTKVLNHLLTNSQGVRRFGSAAMDLCYTAAGRFDAYYEYGLKPWDVAAGALIVQEAGGRVCDFKGEEDYLFGKEILAGNPALCKTFLSLHNQQR
jgi:myo-inositol-1(or 4)-monophosphatase